MHSLGHLFGTNLRGILWALLRWMFPLTASAAGSVQSYIRKMAAWQMGRA